MAARFALVIVCVFGCAFATSEQIVPEEQFDVSAATASKATGKGWTAQMRPGRLDPNESKDRIMFTPGNIKMPELPRDAGNQRQYKKESDKQASFADAALSKARASSEKSKGLQIVSEIMKKRREEEKIKHADHVVAQKMNLAAEEAAKFKSKVQSFDRAKVAVAKAKLEVKAQETIVSGFKKQLQDAQKLLLKKKKALVKRQRAQLHEKYLMEVAGHVYKVAKAQAIRLDKKAQERRRKKQQMRYYAKVAEQAVENAERKNPKKTKKTKKSKKPKKTKKPKKKSRKTCNKHDCTTLPKRYAKQLAKSYGSGAAKKEGSCKDCVQWADDGYCVDKRFKPFMSKFCGGSCFEKTGVCLK